MALLWIESRDPDRLLTEHDVVRAHIAAPHVLAVWQRRDAHFWRLTAWHFAIGAAIPAIGCFLLGWSVSEALLALGLDLAALWVADALKPLLAYRRVREEKEHRIEAAMIKAVIEAMRRRRYPSLLQRDVFGPRPFSGYYLSAPVPEEAAPVMRWYLLGIALLLLALGLFLVASQSPPLLPWVVLGAGLRLASTVAVTRSARRDPSSRPELLAQSTLPSLVFSATLLAMAMLHELRVPLTASQSAHLTLLFYTLGTMSASWRGWNNLHRFTAMLQGFIARDREALVESVRQANVVATRTRA